MYAIVIYIQRLLAVSRWMTANVDAHCGAKIYQTSTVKAVAIYQTTNQKYRLVSEACRKPRPATESTGGAL
jgi:hypothetical protein